MDVSGEGPVNDGNMPINFGELNPNDFGEVTDETRADWDACLESLPFVGIQRRGGEQAHDQVTFTEERVSVRIDQDEYEDLIEATRYLGDERAIGYIKSHLEKYEFMLDVEAEYAGVGYRYAIDLDGKEHLLIYQLSDTPMRPVTGEPDLRMLAYIEACKQGVDKPVEGSMRALITAINAVMALRPE